MNQFQNKSKLFNSFVFASFCKLFLILLFVSRENSAFEQDASIKGINLFVTS
jgi:hypothetical protein